jgi:hypothetical protein
MSGQKIIISMIDMDNEFSFYGLSAMNIDGIATEENIVFKNVLICIASIGSFYYLMKT